MLPLAARSIRGLVLPHQHLYVTAAAAAAGAAAQRGVASGPGGSSGETPKSPQDAHQQQQPLPPPPPPPPPPPRELPSSQQQQQLSRAFLTGALNVEELWMSSLDAKLRIWSAKRAPALKGQEAAIVARVRDEYLAALTRAVAGRALGHRARSQLKQACLAAATYRVLAEAAPGGAADAEAHVGEAMGGLAAPLLLGSLKLAAWAKRLLLRQAPLSQAVETLRAVEKDLQGACECSVVDDDDGGAALTVTSCLYADALRGEGVAERVLPHFCCQHNLGFLRAFPGVSAELRSCIGRGDASCRVVVAPAEGGA